ncbi:MAG: AAA family ATPase, partial [Pseudomonadota bacterium]|nr:AAA family ATPase [Pseudomonadota bacterium]
MLIRFSVTNFLSFHEEVTLDMIPAKGARIMKDHEIVDETGKKVSALPLAAIYGANASGKTNLIKALAFMRNF